MKGKWDGWGGKVTRKEVNTHGPCRYAPSCRYRRLLHQVTGHFPPHHYIQRGQAAAKPQTPLLPLLKGGGEVRSSPPHLLRPTNRDTPAESVWVDRELFLRRRQPSTCWESFILWIHLLKQLLQRVSLWRFVTASLLGHPRLQATCHLLCGTNQILCTCAREVVHTTNAIALVCEQLMEVKEDVLSIIKMDESHICVCKSLGCTQNSSQLTNNVCYSQSLTIKVREKKPSVPSPSPSDLKMPPSSDKSCCYGNIRECQLGASGCPVTSCLSSLSFSAAG